MLSKRPFRSRQEMIFAAVAGPTPGRVSSSVASAVLRFTLPGTPAAPGGRCLADRRHDDLLAVAHETCEVEARRIRRRGESARCGHGIHRPVAVAQLVQSRLPHLTEDVHVDRGRRRGVAFVRVADGAITVELPCGVTAVTNTAMPSPASTSMSATPATRLTRARRGSGPEVALTRRH